MTRRCFSVFPTLPQKSAGMRALARILWMALLACGTGLFLIFMTPFVEIWVGQPFTRDFGPLLAEAMGIICLGLIALMFVSLPIDRRVSRLCFYLLFALFGCPSL